MFPVGDVIPSRETPYVTFGLLATSSVVFMLGLQTAPDDPPRLVAGLAAGPLGADGTVLLTSAFLHDGWMHFAANMVCLWIFGANVEDAMGHIAYLLFYLAAAASGTAAHAALHPLGATAAGANGGVAAVLTAYFVLYPRSQVLVAVFLVLYRDALEVPAVFFLAGWVLLQTAGGAAADVHMTGAAAIAPYVAGLGAGGVAGMVLRRRLRPWD